MTETPSVFYSNGVLVKELTTDNGLIQIIDLPVPRGWISGLTMNCTSNSMTVNCNSGITYSNCGSTINVASNLQKNLAQTWVQGSGGGLAPGLTPNIGNTYHVHAITVNGVGDIYLDTSVKANNAPPGTTAFRRIGSFTQFAANSTIYPFIQTSDRFDYLASINLPYPGAATLYPTGTPKGIRCIALLQSFIQTNNNGNGGDVVLDDPLLKNSRYVLEIGSAGTATGTFAQFTLQIPTDYLGNIYASSSAGDLAAFLLGCYGYIDNRGKDDLL